MKNIKSFLFKAKPAESDQISVWGNPVNWASKEKGGEKANSTNLDHISDVPVASHDNKYQ